MIMDASQVPPSSPIPAIGINCIYWLEYLLLVPSIINTWYNLLILLVVSIQVHGMALIPNNYPSLPRAWVTLLGTAMIS